MSNCSNCGHLSHCDEKCLQTYKDGDQKDVQLNVVKNVDVKNVIYGKNEII